MTDEAAPPTVHAVNNKTVEKIELFPKNQRVHVHLKDGHVIIFDHDSNSHGLIWDLMEEEL
ncbi:hypothetical protein KAR91_87980 [Candidatus Pacearchaeota archaeon]|nr:hypothetical protein [Candidatus Pacearchaeota archaeon]